MIPDAEILVVSDAGVASPLGGVAGSAEELEIARIPEILTHRELRVPVPSRERRRRYVV